MGVAQSLQSTLERMLDFSRLWSSASMFGHSAYGTGHALWNLGVALSSNSIFAFMCFSLTMPFSNTFVWSCKSWDSLCLELQLWLLRFVDILMSLIACQSSWIKKSWSMGIEYCHKSRVQIKHPRVHFFPPPNAFPCTHKLFFILHLCLVEQYCGLPGEKQLAHAQTAHSWKPPLLARKTFPLLQRKWIFFSGRFLSVSGRAWGHANHHCIPEYNWLSVFTNRTAGYGNTTRSNGTNHTALNAWMTCIVIASRYESST